MISKYLRWIFIFALFTQVTSCNPGGKLTQHQKAQKAFEEGKLIESLAIYEGMIASEEASGKVSEENHYEQAAEVAEALGLSDKAEMYYKLAIYYKTASPEAYQKLGKLYRKQGNISKESGVLEPLEQLYPESGAAKEERLRLFQIYIETTQWQKAIALWPPSPQAENNESELTAYFEAKQSLDHQDDLNDIAEQLLVLNPSNKAAQEWKAKAFYEKAETRYQKEIEAYEQNKTRKQYAKMLEGLDASTADFKKALPIFESLYNDTNDKRFALYIANIYARFGDIGNAEKYRKLSQ
jgi:tetratricopeptide (TPR) repeat protein